MNVRCTLAFFVGLASAGIYSVAPQAFARSRASREVAPPPTMLEGTLLINEKESIDEKLSIDKSKELKRTSAPALEKPAANTAPRKRS